MEKRTLVIGDIHGAFKALKQCLERCNFNPETDTLITLGDVVDVYPDVIECIDLLTSLPNKILLWGNHEKDVEKMLRTQVVDAFHISNGGTASLHAYAGDNFEDASFEDTTAKQFFVPNSPLVKRHLTDYYNKLCHYHVDNNNRLFVHAGVIIDKPVELQNSPQQLDMMLWDREMFELTLEDTSEPLQFIYKEIFIGHTPTSVFGKYEPMHVCEVWNMDTGVKAGHKLSIMDVDTKEIWQSDCCTDLYPSNDCSR